MWCLTFGIFLLLLYYRDGKKPFYTMKTQLKEGQVANLIGAAFQAYYTQIKQNSYLQSVLGNYDEARMMDEHASMILNLGWDVEKCVMSNIDQIDLTRERYTIEKKAECGA